MSFNLTKLIEKKRNGGVLSREEITYFIKAVVKSIRNDQNPQQETADPCHIGSMLMACYLKGLNDDETAELTESMTYSGHVFTWPLEWRHLVVDKHSTGGVGDKISLVLAPVLAALGLKVPMISGRSLAHTGGTLDKLESIPGFRSTLTVKEIIDQLDSVGCCIVGQTADCVPADKILYKCREMTATVNSMPLIIASIVSKKLAEGVSSLVYDVKYGEGSNFSTDSEALETAKRLVAASSVVNASALYTSMESPLGQTIGNSLEVQESIQCLKGKGPSDVYQIVEALGCELLSLTKKESKENGPDQIANALKDGRALKIFYEMIIRQGVSHKTANELCYGDAESVLPKSKYATEITYSGDNGYVSGIAPLLLANAWKDEEFLSSNHPGVGFKLRKQIGEEIRDGDVWLEFHHETPESSITIDHLKKSLLVSQAKIKRHLIDKKIYKSDGFVIVENY